MHPVRGNYRLIRPARTPVLTTVEARLGIEPRLSALQADAFPLGYRALAGAVGIGPTPRFGAAALPYAMLLCCWVFQLSKSNKKARFLGRAVVESDCALDSTHPRRALDLSP